MGIMNVLSTIIVGLIVGLLARMLRPGPDKMGVIMTILLGVVGSFLGGFLGRMFGFYEVGEGAGLFGSIIGAIILLFLMSLINNRKRI